MILFAIASREQHLSDTNYVGLQMESYSHPPSCTPVGGGVVCLFVSGLFFRERMFLNIYI